MLRSLKFLMLTTAHNTQICRFRYFLKRVVHISKNLMSKQICKLQCTVYSAQVYINYSVLLFLLKTKRKIEDKIRWQGTVANRDKEGETDSERGESGEGKYIYN